MTTSRPEAELPVGDTVAVVVLASAIGGAVGYLFTVHLVDPFASELEAVWLTTVSFAAVGVSLLGLRRS